MPLPHSHNGRKRKLVISKKACSFNFQFNPLDANIMFSKGPKMNLFCQTEAAQLYASRDSDLQLIVVLRRAIVHRRHSSGYSALKLTHILNNSLQLNYSAIILTKLHVKARTTFRQYALDNDDLSFL
ncbi:hypothetical protein T4D_6705 [Trichinella pseudospiralis]|uniref:Uncharacterized protein n=1 Tax=Trichinella pseudospiralis TaxID=6337 RepID=A0A0V1G2J9_TRIPS|nr:hypothetical protein T4D_6705 [Trichinella pseudospiralis]